MDSREILALYRWAPGNCFRCARGNVPTTQVDQINTPIGDRYQIRACERCLLRLEEERSRHAERTGAEYQPGRLGREKP